jgi:hypothetical protein
VANVSWSNSVVLCEIITVTMAINNSKTKDVETSL